MNNKTTVNEIQNSILDGIKIVVKGELGQLHYDQTIKCTIADDTDRLNGKYKVKPFDGSILFEAYSSDTTYRVDNNVYVLIPEGNYDNQKIITGKISDENSSSNELSAIQPFDNLVILWDSKESEETFGTDGKTQGLVANGSIPQIELTPSSEQGWKEISADLSDYSYFGISANFKTQVEEATSGDYGIRLDFLVGPTKNTKQTTLETVYEQYSLYLNTEKMFGEYYNFPFFVPQQCIYSIKELGQIKYYRIYFYQSGNFYKQTINNEQQKVQAQTLNFNNQLEDLPSNLFVTDIQLCAGYHIDEIGSNFTQIYTTNSLNYSFNQELTKSIFLRWITNQNGVITKLHENPTNIDDYEIRWYEYQFGASSADQYSGVYWKRILIPTDSNNPVNWSDKKDKYQEVEFYWAQNYDHYYYKTDSGDYKLLIEKLKIFESSQETTLTGIDYERIFQEKYEDLSGLSFYKKIQNNYVQIELRPYTTQTYYYKQGETYNLSESTIEMLDKDTVFYEKQSIDIPWEKNTYIYKDEKNNYILDNGESRDFNRTYYLLNKKLYDLSLSMNAEQTESKVKVIILHKDNIYRTNEIVFTNDVNVNASNASKYTNALNIYCGDGTYGNYPLYDQNKQLLDPSQARVSRKFILKFDLEGYEVQNNTDYNLLDAEEVLWSFPADNYNFKIKGLSYDNLKNINNTKIDDEYYCTYNENKNVIEAKKTNLNSQNEISITYEIVNSLKNFGNNFISCKIIKEGIEYRDEQELTFTSRGAADTKYTFLLEFDKGDIGTNGEACYGAGGSSFNIKAQLYDENGQDITDQIGDNSISWTIESQLAKDVFSDAIEKTLNIFKIDATETNNIALVTKDGSLTSSSDWEYCLTIAKASLSFGDRQLIAKLPIPITNVKVNENYFDYITGSTRINYTSEGYANYNKEDFQIFKDGTKYNESNEDGEEQNENNWSIIYYEIYEPIDVTQTGYINNFYFTQSDDKAVLIDKTNNYIIYNPTDSKGEAITAQNQKITDRMKAWPVNFWPQTWRDCLAPNNIDENLKSYEERLIQDLAITLVYQRKTNNFDIAPELTSTNSLKPLNYYVETDTFYGIKYKNGDNYFIQPLLIEQNMYPSKIVNEWDGKSLELNSGDDYSSILSTIMGAGSKDSNGQFSGVLLGDVSQDITEKMSSKIGLYGFSNGAMSFAFKEDGTAFIGKSGHGRIEFDGNNGIIESQNYSSTGTGMKIDLDEGNIDAYGTLTATSLLAKGGTIGGWDIAANSLGSETLILNSNKHSIDTKDTGLLIRITDTINLTKEQTYFQIKEGDTNWNLFKITGKHATDQTLYSLISADGDLYLQSTGYNLYLQAKNDYTGTININAQYLTCTVPAENQEGIYARFA